MTVERLRRKTNGLTEYEILQPSHSCVLIDPGDEVRVHATGFISNTMRLFWSTKDPMTNKAMSYLAGQGEVIKGWDKGCMQMREGEIRRIFVPAKEAYGTKGFPVFGIGSNEDLIFDIECLEVVGKRGKFPNIPIKQVGSGNKTILFMHGWPDDEHIWDSQIDLLSPDYKCLYYTLPWFGRTDEARAVAKKEGYSQSGYSFETLTDSIALGVTNCIGEGNQVIVIGHDWGGYTAELIQTRHPQLIERLVVFDVSLKSMPPPSILRSIGELIGVGLIYQWQMILAYALATRAPGAAEWLATSKATTVKNHMLTTCAPEYKHIAESKPTDNTGEIGYVYWEFQKNVLKTAFGFREHTHWEDNSCPTLFLYGARKPFMFHNQDWARNLNNMVGSASIGLPCGHWLQIEQQGRVNQILADYLKNPDVFVSEYKAKKVKSKL
eukprot:CAMPEP_0204840326 /NCGR_PEP_ID=MMETSP1346-20131115/37283_1 /ASSEMBLY_ACC=CAM_ASM_000771 /TAXON_ID=215587 /ORGANISM="Aplanochytrium stocchinoi, Strain GSBS06" /LENGTH=436 /DNA_ID=CAMNT_0051977637 /DNA_START=33 /DNA_END=1343 /DNA_ORIENTATION=-